MLLTNKTVSRFHFVVCFFERIFSAVHRLLFGDIYNFNAGSIDASEKKTSNSLNTSYLYRRREKNNIEELLIMLLIIGRLRALYFFVRSPFTVMAEYINLAEAMSKKTAKQVDIRFTQWLFLCHH